VAMDPVREPRALLHATFWMSAVRKKVREIVQAAAPSLRNFLATAGSRTQRERIGGEVHLLLEEELPKAFGFHGSAQMNRLLIGTRGESLWDFARDQADRDAQRFVFNERPGLPGGAGRDARPGEVVPESASAASPAAAQGGLDPATQPEPGHLLPGRDESPPPPESPLAGSAPTSAHPAVEPGGPPPPAPSADEPSAGDGGDAPPPVPTANTPPTGGSGTHGGEPPPPAADSAGSERPAPARASPSRREGPSDGRGRSESRRRAPSSPHSAPEQPRRRPRRSSSSSSSSSDSSEGSRRRRRRSSSSSGRRSSPSRRRRSSSSPPRRRRASPSPHRRPAAPDEQPPPPPDTPQPPLPDYPPPGAPPGRRRRPAGHAAQEAEDAVLHAALEDALRQAQEQPPAAAPASHHEDDENEALGAAEAVHLLGHDAGPAYLHMHFPGAGPRVLDQVRKMGGHVVALSSIRAPTEDSLSESHDETSEEEEGSQGSDSDTSLEAPQEPVVWDRSDRRAAGRKAPSFPSFSAARELLL